MAIVYGTTPDKSIFPKTIGGLSLWLDANDSSTLFNSNTGGDRVTTDGTAIGRWEDKSGNSRHALQSTAGVRPTLKLNGQNRLSLIRMDGTQYFSAINTSAATSAFAICIFKIDNDPPTANILAGHPLGTISSLNSHLPWTDGTIYDATFTNARKTTSNPSQNLTNLTMYSVESISSFWESKINSTSFYSTVSNVFQNTDIFQNSATYFLKGFIGEIIVYSPIPSLTNILKIQNYLNNKWKIY
jgi:hypothetical protein